MSSILDKISKVLAKAENTDNEHEADAFLAQAQRMATAHSIDLAVARRHVAKAQRREAPVQKTVDIGAPRAVGNARMVSLFVAIADNNDVTCNVAHNSTFVVAFGFPSDIEVVETLYAHVAFQMVQAANDYLRSGEHKDEYVWNPRRETFTAPSAKTARLSFYDAFTGRIRTRLRVARAHAETDAAGADVGAGTGTALVLADKRAEVADFYRRTSTARGTWRGSRGSTASSRAARRAGARAGDRARLSATPTLPGGRREVGG